MFGGSHSTDAQRQRRELQAKIARLRRRLDRRAGAMVDHSLLLASWRGYVADHPGRSLLAAAGVGIALAAFLPNRAAAGRAGARLYDAVTGGMWNEIWGEISHLLTSASSPAGEAD